MKDNNLIKLSDILNLSKIINNNLETLIDIGQAHFNNSENVYRLKNSDIEYKLNTQGFRTEEFEELKRENFNVICSGCSITYGEAVPSEFSWPQVLRSKLQEDYNNLKLYNLGVVGSSTFIVIKNIFAFIKQYGKPDAIFLMLPNFHRHIKFNPEVGQYQQLTPKNYVSNSSDEYVYENNLMLYFNLIQILELYCNDNNIKLMWGVWGDAANKFIKENNYFNNFVEYPMQWFRDARYKDDIDLPWWNQSQDGTHPAGAWHKVNGEFLYDEFCKKYL